MTASSGGERDGLAAEIERVDAIGAEAERAKLMLEPHGGAALLQRVERRLDQRRAKPVARDQRPAGAAAGGERFADHRGGELRRAVRRVDVERGKQQRLDQPPIERPVAGDDLADGLAGAAATTTAPAPDNRARAFRARAAPDRKSTTAGGRR